MKGDFTRFGFESSKHYSRVLRQQGRVTLDADANEATAIVLHHLRTLTRDLFGRHGGPEDSGFALGMDERGNPPVLWIAPGHYYVDGILCENEAWTDYAHQPDLVLAEPHDGTGGDPLLAWLRDPDERRFWLYLDVWECHVSWIEDDRIRESALGGPDTCTRAKVVWQVRALPWDTDWGAFDGDGACAAPLQAVPSLGSARMAARVDPGPAFTDPCVVAPTARYRGAGNQLYRVEVHRGGIAGTATFKWSRENGSVATRWLGTEGDVLVVKSGRGFSAGDWVEVSHDALELAGLPGQLLHLSTVEADRLTIDAVGVPAGGAMAWSEALRNPKVRRWDQRESEDVQLVEGAVPVTESSAAQMQWIDLEDGVQIRFAPGGSYRSGDYWTIPARVATGDVEWPEEGGERALRPPQGIEHHYAPLGVLFSGDGLQINACRRCVATTTVTCQIPPLPERQGPGPAVPRPRPTPAPRRRRRRPS